MQNRLYVFFGNVDVKKKMRINAGADVEWERKKRREIKWAK